MEKTEEKKIEIITDPLYIIELVKKIININKKSFYTIRDLKTGLMNKYSIDSGNLITRKLLFQVCRELSEDNVYYYVDYTTDQIIHAISLYDWKIKGLGTIYFPYVLVDGNKKICFQDFVLYVYDTIDQNKCKKNYHHIENVKIQSENLSGYAVSFNACYCRDCNKYFIERNYLDTKFGDKNLPLLKYSFANSSSFFMQSEAIIHKYGYTVKAGGPSDRERETLLVRLILCNIVSKRDVVNHLKFYINYHGRKKNMENAVEKWESDLDFVEDLPFGD